MAKRRRNNKARSQPRDWNMVGLIVRSGGKGRHQSKKHKPRSTTKIAFKKRFMDSFHEPFFVALNFSLLLQVDRAV